MNVFCTNCGEKAEEGAKVCAKCGTPLTMPEPIPVYGMPANNDMPLEGTVSAGSM
ncbi:MAG: zinc-ribbon domain-containing protein [Acutalibacteraceae bacterium]|nr:zinc-ribbon domain-containing protein [Acutalibacteraceae bacterium]